MLDEVEEGRLRPLEVVDTNDERAAAGEPLEQLARSPGDLVARRRFVGPSEHSPEPLGSELELRLAGQQLDDSPAAVTRRPAHDLDEWPVGDSFAVWQAAAGHDR